MLIADFSDTIYAIQHLAFEDLGAWEDLCYQHGFRVRYVEAGGEDLDRALQHTGLTILLGGPMSVHDSDDYPFLKEEIHLLKQRLNKKLPTLGIGFGAQLIAHALGAKVSESQTKTFHWNKITLSSCAHNLLSALEDIPVLHWHQHCFDLPEGATLLAQSEHGDNQAFLYGNNVLALKFHAEVNHAGLEKWLIGHYALLRQENIHIPHLRAENAKFSPTLESSAHQIFHHYLKKIMA